MSVVKRCVFSIIKDDRIKNKFMLASSVLCALGQGRENLHHDICFFKEAHWNPSDVEMLKEPEQLVWGLVPASGGFIGEGRNIPPLKELKTHIRFGAAWSHNLETEPATSWQSHKAKVYQLSQPLVVHIKRLVHKSAVYFVCLLWASLVW